MHKPKEENQIEPNVGQPAEPASSHPKLEQMPEKEPEKKKRKTKEPDKDKVTGKKKYWFLAGLLFVLVILPIGLYFYSPLGKLTYRFFRYLPYPVATVEGESMVTTKEMIAGAEAVRQFYQTQDFSDVGMRVDFSTLEGKARLKIKEKDVLDKLIENRIVKKLANNRGIMVTEEEAQREVNRQINQSGDPKALELNLMKLYNWTLSDFTEKVVMPQLYLQKLSQDYFDNNKADQPGYRKINEAKQKLDKGASFEEVAKTYSDGKSAENGGDLGWFRQEQLVPEVAKVALELKPKTNSDIIQSALGYHIISVQEVREVETDENQSQSNSVTNTDAATQKVKEIRLKQVFVSEGGFIDWLKTQKQKTKVKILMRDYVWDAYEARVKFRLESMNRVELDLKAKAEGDPSMN